MRAYPNPQCYAAPSSFSHRRESHELSNDSYSLRSNLAPHAACLWAASGVRFDERDDLAEEWAGVGPPAR